MACLTRVAQAGSSINQPALIVFQLQHQGTCWQSVHSVAFVLHKSGQSLSRTLPVFLATLIPVNRTTGLCKWVQETVTDNAARHQLCVRICSSATSDDGGDACAEGASNDNGAAADGAFGSCTQGGSAALNEEAPEQSYEHVAKRTIGMSVSAPPGVEVITDVWAFKRRQDLFPSPK